MKKLILLFLPTNLFSFIVGKFASIRFPMFIQKRINEIYAKLYKIDMSKYKENFAYYKSLREFFIRPLKHNPHLDNAEIVVSPVDGLIISHGPCGSLIRSKGFEGNLEEFFEDPDIANEFEDGNHISIHLRPSDYHRIHMPISGKITKSIHIKGKLLPVNKPTRKYFPSLYWKNERKFVLIESNEFGKVALAAVGALGVGTIELINPGVTLNIGQELGHFNLGSNVILFFQKDKMRFLTSLESDLKLSLASLIGNKI
ncbi:MAG: archaetidylserine decarboxylase [Pseudomonadota bacterium]